MSLASTLLTKLKNIQLPLPLEEIASERAQDFASSELVSLSFTIFLSIEMLLEASEGEALQPFLSQADAALLKEKPMS